MRECVSVCVCACVYKVYMYIMHIMCSGIGGTVIKGWAAGVGERTEGLKFC